MIFDAGVSYILAIPLGALYMTGLGQNSTDSEIYDPISSTIPSNKSGLVFPVPD
jgi:hypothetical protein